MHKTAESIYFGLASLVLGSALFVMQPSHTPEVFAMQQEVTHEFAVAWEQTIGDQPWFTDVALFYESIASFYDQSATVLISLLESPEADADIAYVFSEVYRTIAASFHGTASTGIAYTEVQLPEVGPTFMTQEPLYNLVPYREVVKTIDESSFALNSGTVSGVSITNHDPANSLQTPWVTLADNATGQLYCLAVYNGTVNQYLGPCNYEGYQ